MTLRHPPALSAGDTVEVVSPAGPVTPEILEPGLEMLSDWALDVRVGEGVYGRASPRDYLAGADEERRRNVQRALDDPEVDAVVFSRGGYGTMRILPDLEFETVREEPKLLVGFSDLTALHLHVAGQLGVATLHGPVVKSLRMHGRGDETLEALRGALFGRRDSPIVWEDLDPVRGGTGSGPLLGGNLTLVESMLSTPYCPGLDGAVLLLEATGEEDYRLDRKLTSIRLACAGGGPAAIVLGDFVGCGGAYFDHEDAVELAASLAAEFGCPVVAGAPVSHETPNVPVPMGVRAEVDGERGVVRIASDAVGRGGG